MLHSTWHDDVPAELALGHLRAPDRPTPAGTLADARAATGMARRGTTAKQVRRGDWLVRECRLYRQGAGCAWLGIVGIALAMALPIYLLTGRSFSAAAATGVGVVLLVSWGASRLTSRRR